MNLRQLASEIRSVRDDLKAIRKALEERHCPPGCACRPLPVIAWPNMSTTSVGTPAHWTYTVNTGGTNKL
jgi:hypothetical protein